MKACSLFLMMSASVFGANIVTNPGFESGSTGWTITGWFVNDVRPGNPVGPNEIFTGCVGSGCITTPAAFFFQDLTTVIGQSYTLSFLLYSDAGTPSQVRALWGGATALDIVNPADAWTPFSTTVVATTTTTRLQFNGRHDPAAIFLDDISVDSTSPVPEPSAVILSISGLTAVALRIRQRRSPSTAEQL